MNEVPPDELYDVAEVDEAISRVIMECREKADPQKMTMLLLCKAVQIVMIHKTADLSPIEYLHGAMDTAILICRRAAGEDI